MVLQRLLENCGFRVRVAQNGSEGVTEFSEWRPQFIWMDLRMPVMDGVEAAGRIRAAQGGGKVKIVAVTASGYASRRNDILASGFDDYIRKPYRPAEVFECMARHLGVRYQEAETTATATVDGSGELTRDHLAALSIELRRDLAEALISLEAARISAAIDRVVTENPALGLTLRRSAERFAYSAMLNAIQRAEFGTGEAGR